MTRDPKQRATDELNLRKTDLLVASSSQHSLWLLAERGDNLALQALVGLNQDPNHRYSDQGTTALHVAARYDHTSIIRTLLQREGVDPNAVQTNDGMTPLHMAAKCGHRKAIRALLADPRVELNQRRFDGSDAIDIAVNHDNTAAIDELMSVAEIRRESSTSQ